MKKKRKKLKKFILLIGSQNREILCDSLLPLFDNKIGMRVYTYIAKNFWKTLQNSKFGLFFRELRSFDLERSITQNNKRQI